MLLSQRSLPKKRRDRRVNQRRRCDNQSRGQSDAVIGFEDKRGPQAKECGLPLEKRNSKETVSPLEPPEGKHLLTPSF